MRKIKYDGKGKTVCPWGMTSFAGGAKIVGSLGCMNCVNHAGQSYTDDGGVVCCLRGDETRRSRGTRSSRDGVERTTNGADGLNGRKVDKEKKVTKRVTKTDGPNGSDGRVKRVTKKVSKNNNKKEEKK
jgi:hypothetical protein